MNIFEIYLNKIKSILIELNKKNELVIPKTFNGITAEIPPIKFDCDISTNVAMVLSKLNNKSPIELAEKISPIIKKQDPLIEIQNNPQLKPSEQYMQQKGANITPLMNYDSFNGNYQGNEIQGFKEFSVLRCMLNIGKRLNLGR